MVIVEVTENKKQYLGLLLLADEGKVAARLLREDDAVVYGDAGYLKMEKHVTDGIKRVYNQSPERNF